MQDAMRIRNMLLVGSDTVGAADLAMVRDILSSRYGGVTMLTGIGSWKEGAEYFNPIYEGMLIDENSYLFILDVVPAELDPDFIRSAFAGLKEHANWIHWTKSVVESAHFELNPAPAPIPMAR